MEDGTETSQAARPIAPAPERVPAAEAPEQTQQAAPAGEAVGTGSEAGSGDPALDLKDRAIAAISNVYDPEIPVNIYELGLIYEVNVSPDRNIEVQMTLTSPHCPVAEWLPMEVQRQVLALEGINDVHVELVWDPPWNPEMMTEAAKLELGFM